MEYPNHSKAVEIEDEILLEFTSKLTVVGKRYETHACIFADRAEIRRKGTTGNLPKGSTVFFSDANAVTSGKASGRAWISFVVPGAYQNPVTMVRTTTRINVASPGNIPYNDPFSIVSGLSDGGKFSEYAERIQEVFNKYKMNNRNAGAVVQATEDNALDKLKKLKELHDMGVLTDGEFAEKKQKMLDEV